MLSRWFSRFKIDPDTLRKQKWFALFGERLLAPALWQGGTRALSGAVAAGIFACWFPIPMHSLIAVGLALAFSLNLPLALLAVWFNNPLTLPFMYLYAYRTGCLVLHKTPEPFHLTWTLHWLEQEAATLVPPSCSAACCWRCSQHCWVAPSPCWCFSCAAGCKALAELLTRLDQKSPSLA